MSAPAGSGRATVTARLTLVQELAAAQAVDVLLISAGADLHYLMGFTAATIERFTCLVLPAAGSPGKATLYAPMVDVAAYHRAGVGDLGIDVVAWSDGQDVYELIAAGTHHPGVAGLDAGMRAQHVLGLRAAMAHTHQQLATPIIREARSIKDSHELAHLRAAAAAIDRVHARMAQFLVPGRSERQAGELIAAAMLTEGHTQASYVIVGSGPNGADPHHLVSERVLREGDLVVVDLAGPGPGGYFSDSTRTYALGEPAPDITAAYAVLQEAQAEAVQAVRPGISAADLDQVARRRLDRAGLAHHFLHRTGHGIGLEVHEDPYIVAGNDTILREGMTFSIEPGIYIAGAWGARIEDIVVVTATGGETLNNQPRALTVLTT